MNTGHFALSPAETFRPQTQPSLCDIFVQAQFLNEINEVLSQLLN